MKKEVIIEGILLLVISSVAIGEGLRLLIHKEPYTLYDPLGPGLYAIAIGIGLMVLGLVHLFINSRKPVSMGGVAGDKKMKIKFVSTVMACVIYIFLMSITGYLIATLVFFLIELRIEGFRSWLFIIILSLVLSGLYYLIFIQICNVVMPRGILFR